MRLTGEKLEREGNWCGPRIVALWFEWVRPNLKNDLRKKAYRLFEQCEKLDLSCTICHINYKDMPYPLKHPKIEFDKYKKRWVRVVPFFVNTLLNVFNSPLLYVHVDTKIMEVPPLEVFNKSVLVSVGKSNYSKHYNGRRTHILGSPVYFNVDNTSKQFAKQWMEYCNNTRDYKFGEHYLLKQTYSDFSHLDNVGIFDCKMSSRKKDGSYLYF